MKGRIAALDAACARINPVLALVAVMIALLDVTVAAHRWAVVHPGAPAPAATVVAIAAERCSPVLPSELRDMVGRD
jgi:hypothetical protein